MGPSSTEEWERLLPPALSLPGSQTEVEMSGFPDRAQRGPTTSVNELKSLPPRAHDLPFVSRPPERRVAPAPEHHGPDVVAVEVVALDRERHRCHLQADEPGR